MKQGEKRAFGEALAAVMEVYGAKLGEAAAGIWWNALEAYSLEAVKAALSAHVVDPATGHFAPKPADLIGRLQQSDGRPGAEEAWSDVAPSLDNEAITVVWTEEMQVAFGAALGLADDKVAARMTFLEVYRREVQRARAAGKPVKWQMSLGTDAMGREGPLEEAVRLGRLRAEQVQPLLPDRGQGARVLALVQARHAALPKAS